MRVPNFCKKECGIKICRTVILKTKLNNKKHERNEILFMDNFALILVIIGALNLGCIGLFGFDVVGSIFGGTYSVMSRIVYTIVALGGLWTITLLFKDKVPVDRRHEH